MNEVSETTQSNNDFDRSLQELAQEAQRHPPLSSQRQIALNRLVNEILRSQRLVRPQKGLWTANFYEDLYNEALQKTLFDICYKIDNYNPEHSVLAWANFLIKNYFLLVINDYQKKGITYMPKSANKLPSCLPYLEDLDRFVNSDRDSDDDRILKQFLEEDPENLLTNERLREHPEVTFQLIALAKFVDGRTWEEIATTLGISLQTLCSFFNRRLQKLLPYFKKYLQD